MTIIAPQTSKASRQIGKHAPLTRRERARLFAMVSFIALLHIVGFGVLIFFVVPEHYQVATGVFGLGTGITAYTLGMRHAFDADHIAAIDNTTRKLMADGKRPLSVGFFFSLGHSTIVVGLTLLLSLGLKTIGADLVDQNSSLHNVGGLVGTLVSGGFLYLLGIINLVILVGILKVFREMRQGQFDEETLEHHLDNRGLMNRVLRPAMRSINSPWQIYPVGILFGLGFDTVTEVTLLVIAGTSVASGLPWYAIMCLPILFAAGMSLLDTIDGSFMNFAYGWAFSKPVRKVYYNITITGLSVLVALLIGTFELLAVLGDKMGFRGGFWSWVTGLDLNTIGYGIVGVFILVWVVALAIWKFGRIEERWSASLQQAAARPIEQGGDTESVLAERVPA